MSRSVTGTNWSGNYTYRATRLHRPRTVEQVQELVAGADRVRALGTRHSFTDIPDSRELVSLAWLEGEIEVNRATATVWLPGGVTYAQLAEVLNREGVALPNLASLPHISVAGAVATATHGSGDASGNLATAVVGLELVTSSGELVRVRRGEEGFDGSVVGLGALGVVTGLTLSVEPYYEVRQRVFEGLEWEALFEHYDEITASGQSVSVFHRFGERTDQVWIKARAGVGDGSVDRPDLFGARPAPSSRNPVPGADPANCTEQLGSPGAWSERLPHFRSGFTPSSGSEIQSELFVAREHAAAALDAARSFAERIQPLLIVAEIRTIAADSLWLSPQYGRPTVGLHFTWRRREAEVSQVMAGLERALAPFSARPHWGKLFTAGAAEIEPLYERMEDFRSLRGRLDPRGAFNNDWLARRVLGYP